MPKLKTKYKLISEDYEITDYFEDFEEDYKNSKKLPKFIVVIDGSKAGLYQLKKEN